MSQNTQATADEELEILSLEPVYSLRDRAAVVAFLQEHVFLIDLLTEAAGKIREHFGSNAQLTLEMSREPDHPCASELLVRIRTDLDHSIASRDLDRFDEDWWLEASVRSDCKMNIALNYQGLKTEEVR